MLTHLSVRNFAIIDAVEIEFEGGMTILTGETGAGKSILIDALALALGGRANSAIISKEGVRAEVIASFELAEASPVKAWLAELQLDSVDGECILRRTVAAEGRSRAYVNGQPAPVQTLRDIGEQLIEIHGQHAHHSLVKRDAQRALLDSFADNGAHLDELAGLDRSWRRIKQELAQTPGAGEDSSRLEFLRFQEQELATLAADEREWETLNAEHKRLSRVDELRAATEGVIDSLAADRDDAVLSRLNDALRALDSVRDADPRLDDIRALIDTANIDLREAEMQLRQHRDRPHDDVNALARIEHRLGAMHDMARKHRIRPDELPAQLAKLRGEISAYENAQLRLQALAGEQAVLLESYARVSTKLHQARTRAATRFARAVTENMHRLGMQGGCFEVAVMRVRQDEPNAVGDDIVEFRVAANPDHAPQPLSRVASGGELSRISLAIQIIDAARRPIPTLIFDEVDVGVGGRTAEIVGRELRELAKRYQVLCVTHLAQVASQGHCHLQVKKRAVAGKTRTALTPLSGENRVREVARMLGGLRVTQQALAHAREMLKLETTD